MSCLLSFNLGRTCTRTVRIMEKLPISQLYCSFHSGNIRRTTIHVIKTKICWNSLDSVVLVVVSSIHRFSQIHLFIFSPHSFLNCFVFWFCIVISIQQIEYIHRRQHISTIDTNSPQRGGGLGVANVNAPVNIATNQAYIQPNISMHTSHAPVTYCTLRNGNSSRGSTNMGSTLSMVRLLIFTFFCYI